MAQHNELGKAGETAALEYLKAHGYQIRHINWHIGHLELDIVAQTDDELVIVEVKTRTGDWDSPEDAVNNVKIKRTIAAADCYIKYFNIDLPARFDIIAVIGKHPDFAIEHIEDAFYPPVNTYRR
jgi:putative endonuclease